MARNAHGNPYEELIDSKRFGKNIHEKRATFSKREEVKSHSKRATISKYNNFRSPKHRRRERRRRPLGTEWTPRNLRRGTNHLYCDFRNRT